MHIGGVAPFPKSSLKLIDAHVIPPPPVKFALVVKFLGIQISVFHRLGMKTALSVS
jgi:hypothetical protein